MAAIRVQNSSIPQQSSLSEGHSVCSVVLGNVFIFLFRGSAAPLGLGLLVV